VEQPSEPVDSEQVQMPSFGTTLQLIDYNDDDNDTLDAQQPTTVSPSPPPRRYLERHQQSPACYNDFVPQVNCKPRRLLQRGDSVAHVLSRVHNKLLVLLFGQQIELSVNRLVIDT